MVYNIEGVFIALYGVASFWMVAVIWFVQIVHYPLFLNVKSDHITYFTQHQTLISWIVLPAMLLEAVSLVLLWSEYKNNTLFIISVILLVLIWISTFFIQVPIHQHLTQNPNQELIIKLIKSNWIRTFLWTIKFITITLLIKENL